MTFHDIEDDRDCLGRGMTGFYGCIWCRQQEKRSTTWGQVFWFCVMFYFWFEAATFLHWALAMNNDDVYIDSSLNQLTGIYNMNCWYNLMYVFAIVIFVYMTILTVCGLLHLYVREPLYMSAWHRVLISLCALVIYSFEILVVYVRSQEIRLLLLSLDITGPYLQIFLVMFLAVLTWPIAWYWLRWRIGATRVYLLLLYIVALILLYVWPAVIHTPITISKQNLPPKPKLIANSGIPSMAPESTLLSIRLAAEYQPLAVQLNVWVSYDGTPFVFHDANLRRTTDVRAKFPNDADKHTAYWKMDQLQKLDAGSWFLKHDPYGVVDTLTTPRRTEIAEQTVPTLAQALSQLDDATGVLVVVRMQGVNEDHPYYTSYEDRIVTVLTASNVTADKIYWLGKKSSKTSKFQAFSTNSSEWSSAKTLSKDYAGVSAAYWEIGETQIKEFVNAGLMTNIYPVNSEWLLSVYWAMGVSSVTTDYLHKLLLVQDIYYTLHPGSYLITWIVADVMSVILILVFWFVNYMIYLNEEARKETILMDPITEKVGYTNELTDDDEDEYHENEEPDAFYGTPPTPTPGSGLPKKKLPYESADDGFE